MNAIANPWTDQCPRSPGKYEFKCFETGYKIEIVPVFRVPFKGLYATMDGLDNLVRMWHDGLTEPQWRKLED